MNGDAGAAPRDEGAQEQVFARPAWLQEFQDDDDLAPPPRGGRVDDDEDFWDDEPAGWRSTIDKVRTTPRAAVALVVVGIIGAVVAAFAVFGSSDGGGSAAYPVVDFAGASASMAPSAVPPGTPGPGGPAPSELVVAVVGLVRAPGLHRLKPGARVADALTAARGALGGADTASLNLAQPLRDGDQIVVGVIDPKSGLKLRSSVQQGGAPARPAGSTAPAGADPAGAVNINTADTAELDKLPGVGPATAKAIVAFREKNGPFGTVDDLAKVAGIGAAKVAKIKPMATV